MKNLFARGLYALPFTVLSLSASLLLSGCWEKDKEGSCTPKGATCNTAAVVVDLSKTTGCGLALHLADSTYVIPTGANWVNFLPKTGQKVTIGYTVKSNQTGNTCAAGKLVELGCITLTTTTTTGAN